MKRGISAVFSRACNGAVLLTLLLAAATAHAAPTGLLNDTGQDSCYDGANMVVCTSANSGDAAANPRQDARYGRDAAAGQLTKIGGGAAGFDFTRVCMSGQLAGQGTCPANPAQGSGADQWACTKDNVTNLIWSLESGKGDWTSYANITYPAAMNASNRCGYSSGWRLPTRRELLSIVHYGVASPVIDSAYFPGTQSSYYWAAETYAFDPTIAWGITFNEGSVIDVFKSNSAYVRLVRSGQ